MPWVTRELKQIIRGKRQAFARGDFGKVKELNHKLKQEIKAAKEIYREQLEGCFQANNPRGAWNCLEMMTDYKKHKVNVFQGTENAKHRADELNKCYCRVDTQDFSDKLKDQLNTLCSLDDPPIVLEEQEVYKHFISVNPRKASGPDGICGRLLKTCARQLAIPYRSLFQMLLNQQCIPSCWKSAVIVPVPKNQRPTENNDFRPVVLTSVVMKSLEKIVLHNLIQPIQEHIDTCQFAY